MTTPEMQAAIKTLELFNEKNEELRTSTFADAIFAPNSGVTITGRIDKSVVVERRGPNRESIKACAPDIRLLISQKDRTSFKKLFEIYEKLPLDPNQLDGMEDRRKQIGEFMGAPIDRWAGNIEPLQIDGKMPTVLQFIEQFIYGDILHLDEDKRANFVNWREDEIVFALAQNIYCVLCARLINVAVDLMDCNFYLISKLKEWITVAEATKGGSN